MANPNLVPLGNPLSNIAVPGGHGLGDDCPSHRSRKSTALSPPSCVRRVPSGRMPIDGSPCRCSRTRPLRRQIVNDRSVSWNRSCAESSQAWSLPAMHSRLYRNGIQHSAIGCTFACSPRSGRLGWIARISRSRRTTALRGNWSRASLATIWISRKRGWQWRIPNLG